MIRFIASEEVRKKILNTYEAIMVAAHEGQRLNARARMLGTKDEKAEKMTTIALERLLDGQIKYKYKQGKEQGKR